MVDRRRLDRMLDNLNRYVSALRSLAALPREEFVGDINKAASAKYHFIIAIECCIDIANHFIASERYRIPKDNADSFVILADEGVLPKEQLPALRAMTRFRNRLAHLYWEVDDQLVADYLQSGLGDFDAFAKAIGARVD